MARFLSRADLSAIGDEFAVKYYSRYESQNGFLRPIDPELLASEIVGLNVKMMPLCEDGSLLGMVTFQKYSVSYRFPDGRQFTDVLTPQDVIIDSSLAGEENTGRRNYTVAHETAHHILVRRFPKDYPELTGPECPVMFRKTNEKFSWAEWQADTLASYLLMPDRLIWSEKERTGLYLNSGTIYRCASDPNYERFKNIAQNLGVSQTALYRRLKEMSFLHCKPIYCHPLDVIMEESNLYEHVKF